jgi:hypothetical protein
MLTPPNSCEPGRDAPTPRFGTRRPYLTWALVALWSATVAMGMGLLAAYANSAGEFSQAPATINQGHPTAAKNQLYMFLHPRCPCSVASVNELARIMARCPEQLDATVYFRRSDSQPTDWERGSLWNFASSIPGAHVKTDVGGRVASQFHDRR